MWQYRGSTGIVVATPGSTVAHRGCTVVVREYSGNITSRYTHGEATICHGAVAVLPRYTPDALGWSYGLPHLIRDCHGSLRYGTVTQGRVTVESRLIPDNHGFPSGTYKNRQILDIISVVPAFEGSHRTMDYLINQHRNRLQLINYQLLLNNQETACNMVMVQAQLQRQRRRAEGSI